MQPSKSLKLKIPFTEEDDFQNLHKLPKDAGYIKYLGKSSRQLFTKTRSPDNSFKIKTS
jgi:hypothetical protein